MGKRIEYLDTLKGISIILVLFCHYVLLQNESILGNVVMSVAWAAVPCFFMVTGGVMHRSEELNWKKHIRRIIKTYTVLLVWKLLYLLFYSMLNPVNFSKVELVKYLFLFGDIANVSTGLMWFMYAYLTALLFFPVTHFLFRHGKDGRRILSFVALLLFSGSILCTFVDFIMEVVLLSIQNITKILPFGSYPNMMFCFVICGFLFEYRDHIEVWIQKRAYRRYYPVIMMVLGIAGLLLIKFFDTHSFMWEGIYLTNGYNRFSTCILAVGLYLTIQNQESNRLSSLLAKYVGTETMGIYYLHFPISALLLRWFDSVLRAYYSFGLNLVKTIVVLIMCVLLSRIMKKVPLVKELVL